MKLTLLIILVLYWKFSRIHGADWTRFATSSQYLNMQMLTELDDLFPPKWISKEIPPHAARLECSFACDSNTSCQAFNFYETELSYVCEFLPETFCNNRTRKALVHKNGSSLWEKLTENQKLSCVEQEYPTGNFPCSFLQSGCLGNWPNCYDCVSSCMACYARRSTTGHYNCTFWPETNVPVFGMCDTRTTFVFKRIISGTIKKVFTDYQMRTSDIYRLYKQHTYDLFQLYFGALDGTYYVAKYANWSIDENGTLPGNMTFVKSTWKFPTDVFQVTGRTVEKFPFVQVTDDRYGCGSFWLLDKDNSMYCPGGAVGIMGPILKDSGGQVLSTGIKLANIAPNKYFWYASVELSFL